MAADNISPAQQSTIPAAKSRHEPIISIRIFFIIICVNKCVNGRMVDAEIKKEKLIFG